MKVEAPWTEEGTLNLSRWQRCPWVHPFTCGGRDRRDSAHVEAARVLGYADPGTLTATRVGWFCAACDYRQSWAHDFMLAGPPPKPSLGGEKFSNSE